MNKTLVKINIFPPNININQLQYYEESVYGKIFSTLTEIRLNKVMDGYSILYRADSFERIDIPIFADNLVNIFIDNFADDIIEIELYYWHMGEKYFSAPCGINIIQLDDYLTDYDDDRIQYNTTESVDYLIESYDEDSEEFDFDEDDTEEDDDDMDPDDEEEEDWDEEDPLAFLRKGKSSKTKKKKSYGSSRILKLSKNPKKNIKRHGLVLSNNKTEMKKAMKKDEKTIRAFLKDFIPGNAKWIKEYRAGILERWMDMYRITKKNLKRLQKEQRRKYEKKHGGSRITKEKAMSFTRKLLNGYNDSWNDPTK